MSERPQNKHLVPGAGGGDNGGGRPKNEYSVTYWAKKLLEADSGKQAQEIAKSMLEHAKGGNAPLLKELLERTEGKVADNLNLSGEVKSYIIIADESKI